MLILSEHDAARLGIALANALIVALVTSEDRDNVTTQLPEMNTI